MLDSKLLTKICQVYNLGKPLTAGKELSGGLLHQLFRIETAKGIFVVKLLNPQLFRTKKDVMNLQKTEEIAGQFAKKGILATTAIQPTKNSSIASLNHDYLLVYPWVEGAVLSPIDMKAYHAGKIGECLSRIHTANLTMKLSKHFQPSWHGFKKSHWQVIEEIKPEIFPKLIKWSGVANVAYKPLQKNLIISHRDLDPKNVLWNKNQAAIVDWEYAGYINPYLDLFIVAMNWSWQDEVYRDINPKFFQAVLKGYNAKYENPKDFPLVVIYGYIGYCLAWLAFNLQRVQFKNDKQDLINQEISKTLNALLWIDGNVLAEKLFE